MISHLRLAVTNPNYLPPTNIFSSKKLNSGDRTSQLQNNLRGISANRHLGAEYAGAAEYAAGTLPKHFDGRGHLEGSCVAKNEGLLQSKKEAAGADENSGDRKTQEDEDGDGEKEKEERKVWKPVLGSDESSMQDQEPPKNSETRNPTVRRGGSARGGGGRRSGGSRGRTARGGGGGRITHYGNEIASRAAAASASASAAAVQDAASAAPAGGRKKQQGDINKESAEDVMSCLEMNIKSLGDTEKDWSRHSKYGKKSYQNFDRWLDVVGTALHEARQEKEDCLFDMV